MPLERQLALLSGLVQGVIVVVHVVELRLTQAIEACVRVEVYLDILRHRLGLGHYEIVEQCEEIQDAIAIFTRDVPRNPPLHEANAKARTPCPAPAT